MVEIVQNFNCKCQSTVKFESTDFKEVSKSWLKFRNATLRWNRYCILSDLRHLELIYCFVSRVVKTTLAKMKTKWARKSYTKSKGIIITKLDKGNGFVILHQKFYDNPIQKKSLRHF